MGYSGRAASKDHPEYLLAVRDNRLILNLIDVDNPDWVSPTIINKAIEFIDEAIADGKHVLIHCNQGMSRSPVIGLLDKANKAVNERDNASKIKESISIIKDFLTQAAAGFAANGATVLLGNLISGL